MSSIPGQAIGGVVAILVAFCAVRSYLNRTDIPKIQDLPEIPGIPIFGNLFQFGVHHAKVAQELVKKYGPVFQVRFGNRRIVFANDFESVKELWIGNQSSLISRPTLHTFHEVVSTSQGFTLGTSPWDESCKKRRKAVGTALNRPSVQTYMPLLDLESTISISELLEDSKNGGIDINPTPYFQRFALNIGLAMNYGFHLDSKIPAERAMLDEIFHVERIISNIRSTSNNWQDYVPLLRLLPGKNSEASEYRERRDRYLSVLLERLQGQIEMGTDKPCITGNVLKDPEAKLTECEIKSICLSMVSAGLDTVPGNIVMGIAYLSSPHGQEIQKRAYEEIMKAYPAGDAWHRCIHEEKVPYMAAFSKEVLRYFSVIAICLPRASTAPILYKTAIIPAGTSFYMNAYAANYDPTHFKDPETFRVERFLDSLAERAGTQHYAFGAGSRMCSGHLLAMRELYTAFVRLIVGFQIEGPKDRRDEPILDALECNLIPTSLTTEPKRFKAGFKPRDLGKLKGWLAESQEKTKDY